ncbi:hypothetical protein BTN50_0002 [Candidatus Enterovibrio altilux]|uniref:Uncharacterized protein n=1 Tax=Candidatus Enterovibrio altilux TaxID=1927128 RepID=A0A291B6C4_9GAMM|nr:hypothetical protein BTN50_0002 [Candidatus Enterovibrio luxaltus]
MRIFNAIKRLAKFTNFILNLLNSRCHILIIRALANDSK